MAGILVNGLGGASPRRWKRASRINTANGAGRAAQVDLRMVEVGDIVVRDLPALIIPDNLLNVNLLGMTFLSSVRWSHERGKLMLEQVAARLALVGDDTRALLRYVLAAGEIAEDQDVPQAQARADTQYLRL